MHNDTTEPFWFPAVGRKKVTAAFDGGRLTSDGGVMLLAAAERRIGIAHRLAGLIADPRNPLLVTHSVVDILRARMRACQESCVEGRLQLNLLLCGEPFAEHDGELRLGGGPFAWRHLPLAADLAQHQEQQLGCRFVIGEVATAAHCGA